ncbi:MAG: MFS transporter [Haliea sp.]|nr:MFS transporter [Haliea sp.]
MNDILIRQFQKALDLSRGQASFIQVSFYLAYAVAAIPAGYAMKKLGFKRAILTGLLLYALGAALFYPAAEVGITASSWLRCSASPSALCSWRRPAAATSRWWAILPRRRGALIFAQSFNGLGGFVAPLIGGVFIFSGIEHSPDAIAALSPQALQEYRALEARQVQLPYLALAGVLVLVALLVAVTRFPASGARASASGKPTLAGVFAHRSFVWAIVAQFFYVGAQIGVWSYFIDFTKELTPLTPEKTAAYYLSASLPRSWWGRFIGTYLMKFIAPRRLLASVRWSTSAWWVSRWWPAA